jgi:lon-related putative ATP-dependent protease
MTKPLPASALLTRCEAERLPFATTDELPEPPGILGQARAIEAIRFAVGIKREGYNLFAFGPPGLGKHASIHQLLEEKAKSRPAPPDWCYVHNFDDSRRPRALRLPAGRGGPFRDEMDRLIEELHGAIPATFQGDDFKSRKKLLEEKLKQRQERAFAEIERDAKQKGVALIKTSMGLGLAPSRDGQVLPPEEIDRLPQGEQDRLKAEMEALQEQLQGVLSALPDWEREHRQGLKELQRELTTLAAGRLVDELRSRYADLPEVLAHLDAVQASVVENAEEFLPAQQPSQDPTASLRRALGEAPAFRRRYKVNLLVDHAASEGAPVVYVDYPTHPNLLGTIEHLSHLGTLVTDFNLIKAGGLHRANGGYLVVDARRVLLQPYAWQELKRALRSHQIRIESLAQSIGASSTVSLEPEPIPLDVKIVMIGDRMLYYLLAQYDNDLRDLFKVAADFEERVDRTPEGEGLYAQLIGATARKLELRPLDRSAVARLIEYGSRLAADAEKLSTEVEDLGDVLTEADHYAGDGDRKVLSREDVQQAIDARIRRADRVRERIHEEIRRGTILIDTDGERAGQVNGLSVMQLGTQSFGRPNRITARVRMGTKGVLDIEREVALGGPLHSKGVLILSGFLGARYVAEHPLSLQASLVFEQSYGGVDGDSASAAELLALISALSEVPIRQCFAVTGSVNQHGQIQAIGGVNEKIEGFFDVCRARGFSDQQGVLIPTSNVKHLMLREDVVAAAAEGRFRVIAIETVDQGIEVLTGQPAGERDAEGRFPEGSVNQKVEARLMRFAEKARDFHRGAKANDTEAQPPKPKAPEEPTPEPG